MNKEVHKYIHTIMFPEQFISNIFPIFDYKYIEFVQYININIVDKII